MIMPIQEKEYKRETFDKEWEKLKTKTEKELLMLIFRELWDTRIANVSTSRTLESRNV